MFTHRLLNILIADQRIYNNVWYLACAVSVSLRPEFFLRSQSLLLRSKDEYNGLKPGKIFSKFSKTAPAIETDRAFYPAT